MPPMLEKRLLQILIAVCALVPVSAGFYGAFLSDLSDYGLGLSADSHQRYLSGLLLGIGLGFYSTLAQIEKRSERFLVLTLIVMTGGLARLFGVSLGFPDNMMTAALVMELGVTPLLCLWQRRIAHRFALSV